MKHYGTQHDVQAARHHPRGRQGRGGGEVSLEVGDGNKMVALITRESADELSLGVGQRVLA